MNPVLHLGLRDVVVYGPNRVTLSLDDKRKHLLISGRTGTGKSTLLSNIFAQEANSGNGILLIDPHGDLAETALDLVPPRRIRKTIYLNPADQNWPVSFNVFDNVQPNERSARAADIVAAFRSVWHESWGPRLEHILYNTIAALLETKGATLLGILKMLTNKDYRNHITKTIQDPIVSRFWLEEFPLYEKKFGIEATSPILNKIGPLVSSPLVRNILCQSKSSINPRHLMDNNYIVIANLSKGLLGQEHAKLLGALLIASFGSAAMSRADIPPEDRKDFSMIIDEFQNYTTTTFAALLSEARKYRLSLTLAHQHLEQMSDAIKAAVLANVGSVIAFRLGAQDAPTFARELAPVGLDQLTSTPNFKAWCRLLQYGHPCEPFLVNTPGPPKPHGHARKIIPHSRIHHATPVAKVVERILRFLKSKPKDAGDDPGW